MRHSSSTGVILGLGVVAMVFTAFALYFLHLFDGSSKSSHVVVLLFAIFTTLSSVCWLMFLILFVNRFYRTDWEK